ALATGKAVAALASPHAIALARGLAQATLSVKVKAVGVALLAAVLAGFGGAAVQQDHGTAAPPAPAERQEVAKASTIGPPAAKADPPKSPAAPAVPAEADGKLGHIKVEARGRLVQKNDKDGTTRYFLSGNQNNPAPPVELMVRTNA